MKHCSRRPLVSLTPCFSWVLPVCPVGANRFNGFEATDSWTCARLQIRGAFKPLKRLTVAAAFASTQLKQGVNEIGRGRKNVRRALFPILIIIAVEILIPVVYRLPSRALFPSLPSVNSSSFGLC